MLKFFKTISPILVEILVVLLILVFAHPEAFFRTYLEGLKEQTREQTLKEAEEIQAQKEQMDYGVLLNIFESVHSIEIHEVTSDDYYIIVTLEESEGIGNYNYQYRINYFNKSNVEYLKKKAEKYDVKVTEVVDPVIEDNAAQQGSEVLQDNEAQKDNAEKGSDEEELSLAELMLSGCMWGFVFIFIYVVFQVYKLTKEKKKKEKQGNNVAVLSSGKSGKDTNIEKFETGIKTRFSDIAGLDEEIEELKEVVDFIKNPKKYEKLGAKVPKGILLHGQPGTGKTLIAKAVAGEAGVNFVSASGAEFINKYVGVGADNMRKLFDEARASAPCIVFIDEIDAIGGKREDEGNSERNQTIDQLLTELDGFKERTDIIILAATNRLDMLDPALKRPGRFDRIIEIGLPDVRAREQILKIHARNKPLSDDVSLKEISRMTSGFTGAQLENLLNESALIAARKEKEVISNVDLQEAFSKVTVGIKKNGKVISDKEKKITANHEAGHAIVGMLLPTQADVKEVSIIPRGSAGGYTMHEQSEDKNYMSKQELTEKLAVLMAGRVAEEIFIGDISTGASQDIEVATNIASSMVSVYGMGKAIGPISVRNAINGSTKLLSSKKLNDAGDEIVELVKGAEEQARKLILEHSAMHQKLVQMLLEKETLTGEDLKKLQSKYDLAVNA